MSGGCCVTTIEPHRPLYRPRISQNPDVSLVSENMETEDSCQSEDEGSRETTDVGVGNNVRSAEACTKEDVADRPLETAAAYSPPVLQSGDLVAMMDKRMVAGIGEIGKPLVVRDDGSYDFTRATVRIISRFTEKTDLKRGSYVVLSTRSLLVIPGRRRDFLREVCETKSKCLRGTDCNLAVGSMVLLDLEEAWVQYWPLVGQIQSIKRTPSQVDMITIGWFEGYSEIEFNDGHLKDGKWRRWMTENDTWRKDTYASASHYFCGFEIDSNMELTDEAKEACQYHIDKCAVRDGY